LKTFFSFKYASYLFIALIGVVLYVPFLGSVHLFDWDEINFAESAREMLVTGNYLDVQINYEVFWEKPPLFIWLQALSMHVFGINEFAARFPNALIGITTLMVLFTIGKKLINEKFGWIWMFAHALSVLTFLYFKSGIIDPLFNLFIFLGIYQFILFAQGDNSKWYRTGLSAFFIGLAILTKGPVALAFILTNGIYLHAFQKEIRAIFKS
jgi:4-amino-4-deoxy-L-arabinose transferase-like glycosyltransferase